MNVDPRVLLGIAVLLLVLGFVLPILMVMQILESTIFLNFFSYTSSVVGLFLGIIGVTYLMSRYRKK